VPPGAAKRGKKRAGEGFFKIKQHQGKGLSHGHPDHFRNGRQASTVDLGDEPVPNPPKKKKKKKKQKKKEKKKATAARTNTELATGLSIRQTGRKRGSYDCMFQGSPVGLAGREHATGRKHGENSRKKSIEPDLETRQ